MRSLTVFASLFAFAAVASAEEPKPKDKPAGPITLTVVSKKDKYVFDGAGKTPKEYKEELEALAKKLEKGERAVPPKALPVALTLVLTNTSKEAVTVYVGGDTNVYTFELVGGAGAVAMNNPVAFTADFRLPKAVTIEPGKTHEIPVKVFADGSRGFSRLVFWTGPGEYKLTAKYRLAKNADGEQGAELKSEPAKIVVAEK
jgi:hypothetical protein